MKQSGAPDTPLSDMELIVEAVYGEAGILWGQRNDRYPIDLRPGFELIGELTTQTSVAYARLEKQQEDHALIRLFDVVVPLPNDDATFV